MQVDRPLSPMLVAAFNTVMAARTIHCVYQPIVAVHTDEVVGYEALARGPAGTTWSTPETLVGYAARVGRLPELDWICRAAACRGALAADLPGTMPLFVNVEPASSRTPCPDDLVKIIDTAVDRLQIVAEVTERSVTSDPGGLLIAIERLRARSNRIALDDVGADAASQAMMSLLRPDVIKLDRSIVQEADSPTSADVIDAARAEAARTGAAILVEGIETPEHLSAAKAMGATLGQGWFFGRPGPLPKRHDATSMVIPHLVMPRRTGQTPFVVASGRQSPTSARKSALIALSRELEDKGVNATEPTVLLTTFEHGRHFDAGTRVRYHSLASHAILTATFAENMPLEPGPGIRGCPLLPGDPLIGEWNVIVIGSKFAGAVLARQTRDAAEEHDREFDVIVSYDRDMILEAARPLLERLVPLS